MKKNGSSFLSLIDTSLYRPGVWDPYSYRDAGRHRTMRHFVDVLSIRGAPSRTSTSRFSPIEYRHIHRGMIPTFTLESSVSTPGERMGAVGESCLLFGTMRAYLGNALVTPVASWIGKESPLWFSVKSEFVQIIPRDGFHYFWWAFLQSPSFLHGLPVGSGGTRPRLHTEQLLQTPIEVPPSPVRENIHKVACDFAQRQWRGYVEVDRILSSALR
jgi:hypothetical protein